MKKHNPKEFLLFALEHFGIDVVSNNGKIVKTKMDYVIEIESENLFKLLQGGQVIAPFSDIEELCQFIKMDMQLNE